MPLGIEQNNLAPQLIGSSGQALVQGIRQIGEQVSQHLTELQTRRDLGAMAQEAQGLDPQNAQFPIQLAQLTGRHPLAARDERAKMLLTPLGVAHAQWQAGEAEARAFNRAMALQTRRTKDAEALIDYKTHVPQNIPNVGLTIPVDPVTGQANVLLPAQPRTASTRPTVLAPGAKAIDATGKLLAENPKPASASPAVSQKRMIFEAQLRDLNSDLTEGTREHQRLLKEEDKIAKALDETDDKDKKAKLEYERSVKALDADRALRKINETRAKKLKIAEELGNLGMTVDEMPGNAVAAPAGDLGLPPVPANAVAPAAPSADVVLVIDPNGRPGRIKASQLDAALQNGYKRR